MASNQIGMLNPTTHAITEFFTPRVTSRPSGIAAGADGGIWFTEQGAGQIGRIDPTTHLFTEYATPTAGSAPVGITTGPDRNVWFTEAGTGAIGVVALNLSPPVVPPTNVGRRRECGWVR